VNKDEGGGREQAGRRVPALCSFRHGSSGKQRGMSISGSCCGSCLLSLVVVGVIYISSTNMTTWSVHIHWVYKHPSNNDNFPQAFLPSRKYWFISINSYN
jgi:hypothetical protein